MTFEQDATAKNSEGMRLMRDGDFAGALKLFDEAIRLNPEYFLAYYWRGLAHRALGNSIEAERDFATAKELGYEAP